MADWNVVAARFLQFEFALILFGASLFYLCAFKDNAVLAAHRRWRWPHLSALTAGVGGLIGVVWWVAIQAATFFPDTGLFDLNSMWIILTETGFGRISSVRIELLVFSIMTALLFAPDRNVWATQSVFGVAILATFAWTGHGIYDSNYLGMVHITADVLHLLAAGVWIGALVPLGVLILRSMHTQTATDARTTLENLDRFSGIGPAVVAVLVLTGLINSWFLVGIAQWRALFADPYGIGLTVKLFLFACMLLLAAANRYYLSPRLKSDLEYGNSTAKSLQVLRASVLSEAVFGLLVLLAVSFIGVLEPPIAN